MPLTVVQRLTMKGRAEDQRVIVHLEMAGHNSYVVTCHVSQTSPPSYSLLLERRSLPVALRPSFNQSLEVVEEPLDIGGRLAVYAGNGTIALPGIITGFEIPA